MLTLLLAIAALQAPPPPVRVPMVPPAIDPTRPAVTGGTLFDGIEAWRRVARAYASGELPEADLGAVHARADAALDAWQRGERGAAIEAWTRLALQLEGSYDELDLVAAALCLECVDGGRPTRIRRGFFSNGSFSVPTSVRVRLLFDLPELAGRDLGAGAGVVVRTGMLSGSPSSADERREFPIVLDEEGRWSPFKGSLEIGHIGFYDTWTELQVQGRPVDAFAIANYRNAADLQAGMWRAAFGDRTPPTRAMLCRGPNAAAKRAFASRVALVVDSADLERSAEFVAALQWSPGARDDGPFVATFHLGLEEEAKRLASPAPYGKALTTPLWRTFVHGDQDLPAWAFVPPPRSERPPPLVVLLHEPGFDEGWAYLAAGGGTLFGIAAEHGVAVLAPSNCALAKDPKALVSLVAALSDEVPIDRSRVVLVAPLGARELAARLVAVAGLQGVELRTLAGPLASGRGVEPAAGMGRVLGLERAFEDLLAAFD